MPGKSKKGGGLESSPAYKKSPLYNYKSPRDYKVFNMGNEASPPFKLRSGNTTPFKMMGSSPLKQSYPSSAQKGPHGPKGTMDEVRRIAAKKAAEATKAANAKKYGMESLNKEINRIAKGGKPKAELLKKTKNVVSKKPASLAKRIYRGLGGKLFGVAGTVLGATKTASADQPGTGAHGGKKVGKIKDMIK